MSLRPYLFGFSVFCLIVPFVATLRLATENQDYAQMNTLYMTIRIQISEFVVILLLECDKLIARSMSRRENV